MRWISCVFALLVLGGCGSNIRDNYPQGRIDPDLYKAAVLDNQQRLAGEDHRIQPIYRSPLALMGHIFAVAVTDPIGRVINYYTHDTEATAVHKMLDQSSPDKRREGTFRLADYPDKRTGSALLVYEMVAKDKDYTVRAAAIRVLNRCRANNMINLYLTNLDDDQLLVRLQAADALSNIPDDQAIPALLDHLRNDVSPDVRLACADALRNFKNDEVASALVDMLDDKNFGVAWQARQSLALITGQDFRYDKRSWLGYLSQHGVTG
jgi:hypothetical protein